MDQRWYLAIDLGTGGIKVAAVHEDGHVMASAFRSVDTTIVAGGGTEQDPAEWWSGVVSAAQEIVGQVAATATELACAGVGITGQLGSTVPVDAAG
ncbi:MAG TPA: FGGY family carbohydrate kinase, partial [Ilumatobacteraceae bacterium]